MIKPKVLILGKLPPPYMGPSIATEIILKSKLNDSFTLIHLDTRINDSIAEMGSLSLKKLWLNLKLYLKIIRLIFKHWPAIVLIPISQSKFGFIKDSIYIFITALFRRKIILHLRGSAFRDLYEKNSASFKWIVRRTMKVASGVIVLGQKLRPLFSGLISEEKIFVVPNGGNYDIPEKKNHTDTIRLLYLSNLMKEKGITDVLAAAALLKENNIPFTLDIAGDWLNAETKEESLSIIVKNQLPVIFYPPQNKKQKFIRMSEADIFLFPPRSPEGHPWVLVESMASGLPIIATDKGAIVESVEDGVNGFIVNPGQPQEIFEKLKFLIQDCDARSSMSQKSRQLYELKFTEDRMVENLGAVFTKIISNG